MEKERNVNYHVVTVSNGSTMLKMTGTHLLGIGNCEARCHFGDSNMWPLIFQLPEELLGQDAREHSLVFT